MALGIGVLSMVGFLIAHSFPAWFEGRTLLESPLLEAVKALCVFCGVLSILRIMFPAWDDEDF